MYSLLVTLAEEAWNDWHHVFDTSRCLEFTSEALRERFGRCCQTKFIAG
jgi:hypothetical protein